MLETRNMTILKLCSMRMPPNFVCNYLILLLIIIMIYFTFYWNFTRRHIELKSAESNQNCLKIRFFPFQITIHIFIQIEFSACLHFEYSSFSIFSYLSMFQHVTFKYTEISYWLRNVAIQWENVKPMSESLLIKFQLDFRQFFFSFFSMFISPVKQNSMFILWVNKKKKKTSK